MPNVKSAFVKSEILKKKCSYVEKFCQNKLEMKTFPLQFGQV